MRLKKRAARERARRFLVEGPRGVEEALRSTAGLQTLFHCGPSELARTAEELGVPVFEVDEAIMERLSTTVTPQGVVGIAEFVDRDLDDVPGGCVALLHNVRDPGNAGAVLRSADASGAQGVVLSTGCADVYNPKTVRAAAGSLFHLPIVRGVDTAATVRRLHEREVRVLGMAADAGTLLDDVDLGGPVAFLFGNESWGLPGETAALADVAGAHPHRAACRVPEPRRRRRGVPVRIRTQVAPTGGRPRGAHRLGGARHPVAAHRHEGLHLRAVPVGADDRRTANHDVAWDRARHRSHGCDRQADLRCRSAGNGTSGSVPRTRRRGRDRRGGAVLGRPGSRAPGDPLGGR